MPGDFFDAEVSGERINKILQQALINIKILISLQEFTRDDWQTLKTLMDPMEYLVVVSIGQKYLKCENLPVPCDKDNCYGVPVNYLFYETTSMDPIISNAIKFLSKNKAATEFCLTFPINEQISLFLASMEEFNGFISERIQSTPEADKLHLERLKHLYSQNLEMNEKIIRYQRKIEALEDRHHAIMAAKASDLAKHMAEIESIKKEFKEKIQEKIKESELQMTADWRASEYRQVDLVQEVKTQTAFVENLLKERLAKEKEMRKKRYKVESQLASILEQYDLDIGDRQRQREELTVQLEEGRLELEQLQERFDAQELEYTNLMQDRANWDMRRFNEKILAIRRQIAARVIQRAFRKYMRRMYGKKKMKVLTKRGKKGKKK